MKRNGLRDKLTLLMNGRYGMDDLGKALTIFTLIVLLISMFFQLHILYIVAVLAIGYSYFRIFSKNINHRYGENQRYLNFKNKFIFRFSKIKNRFKDAKTHCIYKCPNCGQKIRVPRGKGKICIKCPKCRIEFIKRT